MFCAVMNAVFDKVIQPSGHDIAQLFAHWMAERAIRVGQADSKYQQSVVLTERFFS